MEDRLLLEPIQDALDQVVAGDIFSFRFVAGDDTVAQHVRSNGFDVFGGDKAPAF